ncbi:MAG: hypothetical protein H0S79_16585 [Anaerolineaceae bacterium]|nr:hypothetical protein [Anaerolineaceae bacterium]
MTNQKVVFFIALALILAGCAGQPTQTAEGVETDSPAALETTAPELEATAPAAAEEEEAAATECPGDEINPLGESIAADYDFASYDQVMAWFCDGAEFEDILVALETQDVTGDPAGDMLQMLADGLTWDDIWLLVGLDD